LQQWSIALFSLYLLKVCNINAFILMAAQCKVCKNTHLDNYGLCLVCGQTVLKKQIKYDAALLLFAAGAGVSAWLMKSPWVFAIAAVLILISLFYFLFRGDKKHIRTTKELKLVKPLYYLHSDTLKAIEAIRLVDKPSALVEAALFWDKARENRDMVVIVLNHLIKHSSQWVQKINTACTEKEKAQHLKCLLLLKTNLSNIDSCASYENIFTEAVKNIQADEPWERAKKLIVDKMKSENSNAPIRKPGTKENGKVKAWDFDKIEVKKKYCGHCLKPVPYSRIPGDECPYCNAFWVYEDQLTLMPENNDKGNKSKHWSKYPNLIPKLLSLPINNIPLKQKGSLGELIAFLENETKKLTELDFAIENNNLVCCGKILDIKITRQKPNLFSWEVFSTANNEIQ
jgi:hypothetical protein